MFVNSLRQHFRFDWEEKCAWRISAVYYMCSSLGFVAKHRAQTFKTFVQNIDFKKRTSVNQLRHPCKNCFHKTKILKLVETFMQSKTFQTTKIRNLAKHSCKRWFQTTRICKSVRHPCKNWFQTTKICEVDETCKHWFQTTQICKLVKTFMQ